MTKQVQWTQAFSVMRAPDGLRLDVDINLQIKVVSAWLDQDSATAEVIRLSGLPAANGKRYWWQSTHLYAQRRPDSRSQGRPIALVPRRRPRQ